MRLENNLSKIEQRCQAACATAGIFLILFVISVYYESIAFSEEHILEIKADAVRIDWTGPTEKFPKYTTQLMNLANQNAQATRPKQVGQMSDLIQEFPGGSYEEWVIWYQSKYPGAIDDAAQKLYRMICQMKKAMEVIDEPMVRRWVENLVLAKTYAGLNFQKIIIKSIADIKKQPFRLATAEEEAKGIDGYIGSIPVGVSPISYQSKKMLNEHPNVKMIYYENTQKGLLVKYDF